MQAFISLPGIEGDEAPEKWEKLLFRDVGGLPLLLRVIATARTSGVSSILLVHPRALPDTWLRGKLQSDLLSSVSIRWVAVEDAFDPGDPDHWRLVESHLEPKFLWLPWNYVTVKSVLASLVAAGEDKGARFSLPQATDAASAQGASQDGKGLATPAVVDKDDLLKSGDGNLTEYLRRRSLELVSCSVSPGTAVSSARDVKEAEGLLIRGSGKASDGFHSKLNRWLSRPVVRWLLKTPVTPNMVTWAGLPVVALSGYWYAKGHWSAYVIGGLVYFASVLLDEVDGMLARTKFQESPFGCWLETFVDYVSYLVLWSGMSIGLYRQYGSITWPILGMLVMVSNVLTFFVLIRQRKVVVPTDHPEQYQKRFYGRLEADSASLISRMIRKVVHFAKRGVMCHFILLFSILNLVPLLFGLVVTGSALTLIISIYMNRLFRLPVTDPAAAWGRAVKN
ncbi:MAG: CDP-alcohol phosphatidyltransferase family protein [Acidobacteriota bacterium]